MMATFVTFSQLSNLRGQSVAFARLFRSVIVAKKKYGLLHPVSNDSMLKRFSISPSTLTNEKEPVKCWKCQTDLTKDPDSLFNCPGCKSMRHPENYDFFQVFQLDQTYDIDNKVLSQRFKALQRMFHPDIFAQKPEDERELSETWSSLINVAYETLQKPHLRANYLLSLHGESISEGDMTLDPEFLLGIMELNEDINEALTPEEVLRVKDGVTPILSSYDKRAKEAFDVLNIEEAKKIVSELQYYVNLKEKIIKKELDLGMVD